MSTQQRIINISYGASILMLSVATFQTHEKIRRLHNQIEQVDDDVQNLRRGVYDLKKFNDDNKKKDGF